MRTFFQRIEPYLTPLLAFSGLFLVSMILLSLAVASLMLQASALVVGQIVFVGAAISATAICVFGFEGGRWRLGILIEPRRAMREAALGVSIAVAVVVATHLVIMAASDYATTRGDGFDWLLVGGLLLPAAFGEELVFRGYVLQKLYDRSATFAVLVTSLLFAVVHAGNPAVGPLALTNIFLAGVLFAFMWAWGRSLWMPTWAHFAWNVLSGSVLGHELSGQTLGPSVFRESDPGPAWLTGGQFGIEGSIVLTVIEIVAIFVLLWRIRIADRTLGQEMLGAEGDLKFEPDRLLGSIENQNDKVRS